MPAVDSRKRALLRVASLWLAGLAAPLRAQPASADSGLYRSGLPPVLTPEPSPGPALAVSLEAFRTAYQRAGRPRVVVFWNRELDDELVDRKSESVEVTAAGVQVGPAVVGAVSSVRNERIDNAVPRGGLPAALAPLESGFVQRLAELGVRLVDRASVLRLEHAKGRRAGQAENDTRAIEIDAISARAEVLLEVVLLRPGPSPENVEVKLLAKDTRSGELLFASTSQGKPPGQDRQHWRVGASGFESAAGLPAAPTRFVATAGGFEREPAKPRSWHEVGQQIGLDLVQAWQTVLPPPR